MLAKNNHRVTFSVQCHWCGEVIQREYYYRDYNYKCDECKKKSQKEYNRISEAKRKELANPRSIWDIKLEHYKLTKSVYGRRSD